MAEKKLRALVVDDEASIRRVMQLLLEKSGFSVDVAVDGEDAVERLERGEQYDIFLVDRNMPGIGGLDVIRRVREVLPTARALLMTAYASVDNVIESRGAGASGYIVKPFENLEAIVAQVREVLIQRDAEVQAASLDKIEASRQVILDVAKSVRRINARLEGGRRNLEAFPYRALLVSASDSVANFVREILGAAGYELREADSSESAIGRIAAGSYNLVVVDDELPRTPAADFLKALREKDPLLEVILLVRAGVDIDDLRLQGAEVLRKPVDQGARLLALADRLASRNRFATSGVAFPGSRAP